MRAVQVGLLVALALALAVAANLALLGVASRSNEPVGKLSPSSVLIEPSTGPPATTATTPTTTTTTVPASHEPGAHEDD